MIQTHTNLSHFSSQYSNKLRKNININNVKISVHGKTKFGKTNFKTSSYVMKFFQKWMSSEE
jgi:hypothetical protein